MLKDNILKIFMILMMGVGIQLLLILLGTDETKDSPRQAVVEFSKAYFKKDPHMSDRICKAHLTDETRHNIENYIQKSAEEARSRGLSPDFMASMLYSIKTDAQLLNDTEAIVRITGKRKTAIHPVYFLIGLFFNIGDIHQIDHAFRLIKEGNQWKICENFSAIFQNS